MSVTSPRPLRMAGANTNSGNVNTGEIPFNRGGAQVVSVSGTFSGNPDGGLVLVSGVAGRVNSVILHNQPGTIWAQSGIVVNFYDGNSILTSGGPFAASGHKVLGILNGPVGNSGQIAATGKFELDMPFQSGLMVRAASGAPGFSVSWTPETNQQFN